MHDPKYVAKTPDAAGIIDYTESENQVWQTLYNRQEKIIEGRACKEFMQGLEVINFSRDQIPQLPDVEKTLKETTGWGVQAVPAIIKAVEFFTLLSEKKFPVATFIRIPEELDYIKEPDIFHELFGHCPLLTNPDYANFIFEFGKLALSTSSKNRQRLFRLFWFTIEFGLIQQEGQMRSYGGGILSSISETVSSVEDQNTQRRKLDALEALRTPYRIDIIQPLYYYIEDFSDLYKILKLDLLDLVEQSFKLEDHPPLFEAKGNEL